MGFVGALVPVLAMKPAAEPDELAKVREELRQAKDELKQAKDELMTIAAERDEARRVQMVRTHHVMPIAPSLDPRGEAEEFRRRIIAHFDQPLEPLPISQEGYARRLLATMNPAEAAAQALICNCIPGRADFFQGHSALQEQLQRVQREAYGMERLNTQREAIRQMTEGVAGMPLPQTQT